MTSSLCVPEVVPSSKQLISNENNYNDQFGLHFENYPKVGQQQLGSYYGETAVVPPYYNGIQVVGQVQDNGGTVVGVGEIVQYI